jgi:ATP-binding cassette subfamily B (MDR/TAP) protein 1
VPLIAKSKQAAADFSKVLKLGNITSETRGIMRVPISGDITFEDVGFSYPTRPNVPVLRGIDATIKQGECVAIVGASGSGKSTIASLLQRLYEPTSGRIAIGGSNIADTDVSWLRDHVAVVSQNPSLFDASIADNIAYGCDPSRPLFMEDIQSAARDAQLHDFVMSLPNGYETMIGEKAALLSGGQAQRLSIARSLAKKDVQGRSARIMVFDECTSALDAANQEAVIKTIMNVKAGKTTMLITHKLPVMQMCDRILMIDAGCVVEEGKYHELMARNGVFAQHANGGEWT